MFQSISEFENICKKACDETGLSTKVMRGSWSRLAMPPGTLNLFEEMVCWLGRWQKRHPPVLENIAVNLYVAKHGISQRNVTPWSSGITHLLMQNLQTGRSAINCVAHAQKMNVNVYPLNQLEPTRDFLKEPAMSEEEFLVALQVGYDSIDEPFDLLCLGEIGIGNTTCASAICCALTGQVPEKWCSHGTGGNEHIPYKLYAIRRALDMYSDKLDDPFFVARALGGFEMVAIMGAVVAARLKQVPIIIDGFVALAAIAPLAFKYPTILHHVVLSHTPTYHGHTAKLAEILRLKPCLKDCDLRLGEGTGAASLVPFFRSALACYEGMAHFSEG